MMSVIPMGQPILIGHYSESRDRNYRNRAWNKMGKSVAQSDLATHHESKADGLAAQLDGAIFSDDTDAEGALEARIAEREAQRDKMKQINVLYKKRDAEGLKALGVDITELSAQLAKLGNYFGQAPYMPYSLTNLGACIRKDKERLQALKAQQARTAAAASSNSGVTCEPAGVGYVRITFAEKPARHILEALRAAGFYWMKGSWGGKADGIPAVVAELLA
jgi:hypothetical protein